MAFERVIRTGHPLTLDQIRHVAPAVFAEGPHQSRGERYLYVPTIEPLQAMMKQGWSVYEARQQRSRKEDRDPYTKHMLRLRRENDPHFKVALGQDIPEVILINAHDGTARYHLRAGIFRFVCSNGMMVGNTLAGFSIIHTKSSTTNLEVLEAGERVVTEKFPVMVEQRERMMAKVIDGDVQYSLATTALKLRYGSTMPPFQPSELLACRREEDRDPTVWNILNRIQENVLNGGWETRSVMFGRRSMVRPVERVSAVVQVNAGLWDAALALAE